MSKYEIDFLFSELFQSFTLINLVFENLGKEVNSSVHYGILSYLTRKNKKGCWGLYQDKDPLTERIIVKYHRFLFIIDYVFLSFTSWCQVEVNEKSRELSFNVNTESDDSSGNRCHHGSLDIKRNWERCDCIG